MFIQVTKTTEYNFSPMTGKNVFFFKFWDESEFSDNMSKSWDNYIYRQKNSERAS